MDWIKITVEFFLFIPLDASVPLAYPHALHRFHTLRFTIVNRQKTARRDRIFFPSPPVFSTSSFPLQYPRVIIMSNNNTYDKNADIPSGGEDSNLPNTGSEHKMDLDACDDKWMKYFNADIFEPYSPSDPFFIHSLLKNLDKHRQMLERRDNDVDFVGSNNIAVIVSFALFRFHVANET
jgi:hypothetical protein